MGKIKLDKDQKAYLETTAGSDITLAGFTKAKKALVSRRDPLLGQPYLTQ
jgi:hypothetical protein